MNKSVLSKMTEDDRKIYKKKLVILIGLYVLLFALIAAFLIVMIKYSEGHMFLPAYSQRHYAAQVCGILFSLLIPIIWFISNIKSDIKRMTRKPEWDFDSTELDESEYEAERLEAANKVTEEDVKKPLTREEKIVKRLHIIRNILIAIALIILLIVIIITTTDSYFDYRSGLRFEFIVFTIFIVSAVFIPPIALLHFIALNKKKQIKE